MRKELIKPHLNVSKHGYVHEVLRRLRKGLATRKDIEIELSKRSDEKEVRRILNEIMGAILSENRMYGVTYSNFYRFEADTCY